jgi:prepilin signal peptidase PulO-like enzyme (type II secretory pathway)
MIAALSSLLGALIAAGVFACAAFLGIELSVALGARVLRDEESPEPRRPAMRVLLVAAGILGAIASFGGADWQTLLLGAVVCVSLAGCWHGSLAYGTMSDAFTLIPLGAVLISSLVEREWILALDAAVPFVPFAIIAFASKGRGLGWDDAKLAALAGALLGIQTSMLVLASASLGMVLVAVGRNRKRESVAFGPYMIGAIGLALVWRLRP